MSEPKFVKGMNVKEHKFENGGSIIKLGIDMNKFYEENPINERGYLNVDLKRSKEKGTLYAVINDYKPKAKETTQEEEPVVNFDEFEEDEIPF